MFAGRSFFNVAAIGSMGRVNACQCSFETDLFLALPDICRCIWQCLPCDCLVMGQTLDVSITIYQESAVRHDAMSHKRMTEISQMKYRLPSV